MGKLRKRDSDHLWVYLINNMKKELIISVTILSLALVIFGFLQYKTKVDTLKMEQDAQVASEQLKKSDFNNCVKNVDAIYSNDWDSQCKAQGLANGCDLSLILSSMVNERQKQNVDRCVQLYK